MSVDESAIAWQAIADHFKTLKRPSTIYFPERKHEHVLHFGNSRIHYEWNIYKREEMLDVALHFESDDPDENARWLKQVEAIEAKIKEGIDFEFKAGRWGRNLNLARIRFRISYKGTHPVHFAPQAANLMKILIDRTYDLVKTF